MFYQVMKILLVGGALCGLCATATANTTANAGSSAASSSGETIPAPAPALRIGLLLPTRSPVLADAAAAVQQGFVAAHGQEKAAGENNDIGISIFETGDSAQEVLTGYRMASEKCDLVVGPLTRSGVAAIAKYGKVSKPTLALAAPESVAGSEPQVPPDMLVMGLSIEGEARQAADWASFDNSARMALVVFTRTAWQRRAATAFDLHWQRLGYQSESIELVAQDGYLSPKGLNDLRKRIGSYQSVLVFAALDAVQARQLRQAIGNRIAVYGTSQLNSVAVSNRAAAQPAEDMNGMRLLDIPWQLQADDPAIMIYPKLVLNADRKHNADLERLYALGIDAFRIAQEIARGHRDFDMEGMTGKLSVHLDAMGASFERTVQRAIYRNGVVVAETER